jgi:hypothetical protein
VYQDEASERRSKSCVRRQKEAKLCLRASEKSLTSVFGQHGKSFRIGDFVANLKQRGGLCTVDHDKETTEWLFVGAVGDFDDWSIMVESEWICECPDAQQTVEKHQYQVVSTWFMDEPHNHFQHWDLPQSRPLPSPAAAFTFCLGVNSSSFLSVTRAAWMRGTKARMVAIAAENFIFVCFFACRSFVGFEAHFAIFVRCSRDLLCDVL